MSNLTYWELDYVHDQMKLHNIKFQEIYNELFDHIVTAIEAKRAVGDTSSVQVLYKEVEKMQFGGYDGIEEVAKSHEKGYKSKVKKMIWSNFRYYINIKTLLFTIALIVVSYYLPHTKLSSIVISVALFIAAMHPSIYAYIKLRSIKPSKGKISLVYSHTITQANLPALLLYSLLWLPQLHYIFRDDDTHFKLVSVPLPYLALLLALILIYDLSCIRLCKQELKQFVNINPNV